MNYLKLKAPAFGSAIAITLLAMSSASMADAGVRGDFVVVGVRTASDVAGTPPTLEDRSGNIGNTVSFGPVLVWNDGTECDDWSLEVSDSPVVFQEDPNLSDLQVPPVDAAHSAGDQRENTHYNLLCRGETLGAFLKVDDRTLVVPHASGRTYEILERPLTGDVRLK